ncbi:MAG: hypothetical protein QNJ04_03905 [Desulfobacterales bacterium]|nr:hypothetical protein [Desulfobacterales bacterium]
MRTLNNLRRLLVNYIVLLGIMSAMVVIVDFSDRQVQHAVENLETKNRQLGEGAP